MTTAEQNEYWLKFYRFQRRHENIYTPKFNRALREQVNAYIATGTMASVSSTPVYKVLNSLYLTISPIWAAAATVQLRTLKVRMPMGFSQRIVDAMIAYFGIDLLNDAEGITDTTKLLIQRVLSQAAAEGFGFDEIVKRLQVPELTSKRARLIARTETVAAANAASNIAARETGLLMDKIWISARDNRTRPDHRTVNQSVVAMEDRFQVGDTLMLYPGDKAGGAAQVCNCRCVHAFVPRRDKDGRLVRV